MKDGTEKLAELINSRIQAVVQGRATVTAEIGRLKGNGDLAVSSLSNEVSQDSYYITDALKQKREKDGRIAPAGSKVLVIWAGSIPIIVDALTEG